MRPAPPRPDTPNTGRMMRYTGQQIQKFEVKRARLKMGVSALGGAYVAIVVDVLLRIAV